LDVHFDVHLVVAKKYSIADARKNLPGVVNDAAAGVDVQLTRRGEPVAVLVSITRYERLKGHRGDFANAYAAFPEKFPQGSGIEPRFLRGLRDRICGRKVGL